MLMIWMLMTWTVLPGEDVIAKAEALMAERPGDAITLLSEAVESGERRGEAALLLARCHRELDEKNKAIKWAEKAVKWLPDESDAHLILAQTLSAKFDEDRFFAMRKLGAYKAALNKAIALNPKNEEALSEKIGFNVSAPAIAGASKETARKLIEDLLVLNRERGLQMRAYLQRTEKDSQGMITTYGELVELVPEKPGYRFRLGYQLALAEQFGEAVKVFAPITGEENPYPPALYQAARAHILGEFEIPAAVDLLERYLTMREPDSKPTAADAMWRIGVAKERMGDAEGARQAYKDALNQDANHAEAKKSLRMLGKS